MHDLWKIQIFHTNARIRGLLEAFHAALTAQAARSELRSLESEIVRELFIAKKKNMTLQDTLAFKTLDPEEVLERAIVNWLQGHFRRQMQQQLFVLCITPSLQIFHLRRHCQGGVYTVFLQILSKKTAMGYSPAKLLSFLVEFIEMWTKIKKNIDYSGFWSRYANLRSDMLKMFTKQWALSNMMEFFWVNLSWV